MNPYQRFNPSFRHRTLLILLSMLTLSAFNQASAATITLWDTISPLAKTPDLDHRALWKQVPSNLLTLEDEPAKAASDPGYYGKEYTFKGDAVVQNQSVIAVFHSRTGRVGIHARDHQGRRSTLTELTPIKPGTQPLTLQHCHLLRHATDEVALDVTFGIKGGPESHVVFVFDRTEIVEVRPDASLKGVTLRSPIEYGVIPAFIGDDLIVAAPESSSTEALFLPVENVFMALLKGNNTELILTWPQGSQRMTLGLAETPEGRSIQGLDFFNAGQSFYLATLNAPGIWHRETLAPTYLEKDVALTWKPPFPAKWKTQLSEAGVPTTYAFRESKGTVWRGVPGSYNYPAWFEGDNAFFRLGKKVPPKGEALIYALEPQDTPFTTSTPIDIIKATLGRAFCQSILDLPGRKLRTHHRRGDAGVARACTCGCTDAIQAVFQVGEEVARKEYVDEALEDMIFFVRRHLERIAEYQEFARGMIGFLQQAQQTTPKLKSYLQSLEEIAKRIPEECQVQQENMKSLAYAEELAGQTRRLAGRKDPENLKAYNELLKAWRAMGGAQDYVLAQCHTITRQLFQEAGYGSLNEPAATELATSIRARCRQCLRNPDGYEIWANY